MSAKELIKNLTEATIESSQVKPEDETKTIDKKIEKIDFSSKKEGDDLKIAVPSLSSNNIINSSYALDFQEKRAQAIDTILAEGLDGIFLKLSPSKQKEFKIKGEETVKEINGLLSQTKIKVKKILKLIKKWLKIIPGINKFFLEQESKIKTDKIIKVKNKF